jgi:hypothetical protein
MRFQPFIAVSVGGLLLTACAGVPAYESIPPAAKDQIASTEVVVPVKQNEIYVYVPPSDMATAGAAGGGAIGGLLFAAVDAGVNSVRTSKAEDAVKPLRDALVDYSFDRTMQNDMQASLASVPWLHVDNVHVLKEATSDSMDRALDSSRDSAVLFASADYQLSNDADLLTVTVSASLFPKSDALRALKQGKSSGTKTALANSLYHNTLVFEYHPQNTGVDRPTNIANWSANNGAAMRAALDESAKKLAWLLAQDVQSAMGTGNIPNAGRSGVVTRAENGTLKFVAFSAAQ